MVRAACTRRGRRHRLVALCVIAAAALPAIAEARGLHRYRTIFHRDYHAPRVAPFEFPGSQYAPVAWSDIAGWAADDHVQAFRAFRASCVPIAAQRKPTDANASSGKTLGGSLRDPCLAARSADISDDSRARAFFESNFKPVRISRLGEPEGFVTGYYEPVVDGSRVRTDVYTVPVYRRASNLFVRGFKQDSPSLPNGGDVFRKIGRRKLVPYYDRAQIEDGAIAGRGLEICWLKNQTDLLFTQIQGSARVRLEDGGTIRINYDAHNGYRYTPVGRVLIDRGAIPREQMSMARIRQWMEENPDGANDVRRQNRSYVFFREVKLSDKDEAVGAQGVPLTPGRSIAVDKTLHVYGTPFFIEGELPVESEQSRTPFHRLMVAQDTGSAIVGPARADLYFGAGAEAGRVAGRMRHAARFVMLVPNSLDPAARGRTMPLPDARPSAKIAKLFPQTPPPTAPAVAETTKADVAKSEAQPTAGGNVKGPAKPEPDAKVATPAKSDPCRTAPVGPAKPDAAASAASPPAGVNTTPAARQESAGKTATSPVAASVPLPAPKPAAVAAAGPPAATAPAPAAAVPLPDARPETAPATARKPERAARHEARPRRVRTRHRAHRRAAPVPSPFRFFWQ